MAAPHVIEFEFAYDNPGLAGTVERSLAQEVGEIDDDRSSTTVARDGSTVSIRVEAADLVALRAAANTWLSLTTVAERVADKAGVFES